MSALNVPTFAIVTGASRGIGKEIAIQLAEKFCADSYICLVARNKDGLEDTARTIKDMVGSRVRVACISADLSNEANIMELNGSLYKGVEDVSKFDHVIIIHNAASIGPIGKFVRESYENVEYLRECNTINLTAPMTLTSGFLKMFDNQTKPDLRSTVVQISSIASTTPFKAASAYCMAKAAGEMFFRVLALEEPKVRVLSYDPGFVDTDMFQEVVQCHDEDLHLQFSTIEKQKYFLETAQSAKALIQSLEEDTYESGALVKCYDVLGIPLAL